MQKSKESIFTDIDIYVKQQGGRWSDWFVGVTHNPEQRLAKHNVDRLYDKYIIRECSNALVAQDLERFMIDVLRADGAVGDGDRNSNYVYIYKKNQHTLE